LENKIDNWSAGTKNGILFAIKPFKYSSVYLARIVRNYAVTVSVLHIFESEAVWSTVALAFHKVEYVGLVNKLPFAWVLVWLCFLCSFLRCINYNIWKLITFN
jgi:hypothetical protein